MEKTFRPDRKYFTKVMWIQLTITVLTIIGVSLLHLIIWLAKGKPEAALVLTIIGISGLVLMWIISTIISRLWIKNLKYLIYEDRVIIHKGILKKTEQNIPFRAITDFALERSLYDRILKLGSIKIQTAGQSRSPNGYEGKLAGLIDYEKRHTELREKIKSLHSAAGPLTTSDQQNNTVENLLQLILNELKEIKKMRT